LQWLEGKVPTPHGAILVRCSTTEINITSAGGTGLLRFKSSTKPVNKNEGVIQDKGNGWYELELQPYKTVNINYKAVKS
jgi:alpha-L-rhamnosidase